MYWKSFQIAVFLSFLILNIQFQIVQGIAGPVMGGMLAYYLTGLVAAVVAVTRGRRLQPHSVGQRYSPVLEAGSKDMRGLGRKEESNRQQQAQEHR